MWALLLARLISVGLGLALAGCAGAGTPAPTATPAASPITKALGITASTVTFPSYACRTAGQDPCRGLADAVFEAKVASKVAGDGTLRAVVVIDDTDPGPNGDCNTVDETGTFTFSAGSIAVRSLHRDCNFGGPRTQTLFIVTGGTGSFSGATGFGTEKGTAAGLSYDGMITYSGSTPSPS